MILSKTGWALAAAVAVASAAPGFAGPPAPGTDAFGNLMISSDDDARIVSDLFVDISDEDTFVGVGDESYFEVDLGFAFPFYGEEFEALTFSANGFIATDADTAFFDLSHPSSLPNIGDGGRILVFHDDLEAEIYGAYYEASESPYGTEMFVTQWDACYFPCDPTAPEPSIQANTFLLRDGTAIIAYNAADDGGSGAMAGIQSPDETDGFAYFSDTAGAISNGETLLILPEKSGISEDIQTVSAELGAANASTLSRNIRGHVGTTLGADYYAATRAAYLSTGGVGPIPASAWAALILSDVDVDAGSDLNARGKGLQVGFDFTQSGSYVAGLGLALSSTDVNLGPNSFDQSETAAFAYAGFDLGSWNISTDLSYAWTKYSDYETFFLSGLETEGRRTALTLAASTTYMLGDIKATPEIAITAGREQIDAWSIGSATRDVDTASFVKAEITSKFAKPMGGGEGYILAGIDALSTNGDDELALYAYDYSGDRVGGVLGLGWTGSDLSAELTASGIGSDHLSLIGRVGFNF